MKQREIGYLTQSHHKRQLKEYRLIIILALLTICLCCIIMIFGNTVYSPRIILRVLGGEDIRGASFTILTLRLPRMLTGLFAGLAFGMAGSVFQRLLHNPLASPDIIGITSGSSTAAVFALLILRWSGGIVSVFALCAGALVACLIYGLSRGRGFSNSRLILIGIGSQAFLGSLTSAMILKASEYDVATALRWLSGSLNNARLERVPILALVVMGAGAGILLTGRWIQALEIGDDYAQTLGIQPSKARLVLILLALCLTAFASSQTGPIASVSFLSGPVAGRLLGRGRNNTAAAGLVGALLVLAADFAGQYALPARYPVGVITGMLGAPYLLYLLLRMNRREGTIS